MFLLIEFGKVSKNLLSSENWSGFNSYLKELSSDKKFEGPRTQTRGRVKDLECSLWFSPWLIGLGQTIVVFSSGVILDDIPVVTYQDFLVDFFGVLVSFKMPSVWHHFLLLPKMKTTSQLKMVRTLGIMEFRNPFTTGYRALNQSSLFTMWSLLIDLLVH